MVAHLHPRGPTLYATLQLIIQTEHADKAMDYLRSRIAADRHEDVHSVLREISRRAYVDGLQDGFTQGVRAESERKDDRGA